MCIDSYVNNKVTVKYKFLILRNDDMFDLKVGVECVGVIMPQVVWCNLEF